MEFWIQQQNPQIFQIASNFLKHRLMVRKVDFLIKAIGNCLGTFKKHKLHLLV